MKRFKILLYSLAATLLLPFSSCKDESLNPVLAPETAVHGYAQTATGSATSFFYKDMTTPISIELQWISIDKINTVTKMDIFVNFKESYVDAEGNPRVANHGTKKVKTLEGSAVPANRAYAKFSISPNDVYTAFKDATFDYGDGKGKVSVFTNTFKKDRTSAVRFTADDAFRMTWAFTTADGRFFDSWSDSVCSEFPGANCDINWAVVCNSKIEGTYIATTKGTSTDDCCKGVFTETKEVKLTKIGDGKYTISDWSAGLYLKWYAIFGIDPSIKKPDGTPQMETIILDVCGTIKFPDFTEPFGEKTTASGKVNDDGTISYAWVNGYGDKATVLLTPKK